MTKEELEKRLSAFKEQLLKECSPTQFEVGKVYKTPSRIIARFKKIGSENYGFINGNWHDDIYMSNPNDWEPATTKKWEQALIKEAERKYNGKNFKCLFNNERYSDKQFNYVVDFTSDIKEGIHSGNGWCYVNGKWAEIIKDEKIEIGGYEVKFYGSDWPDNCVTIDGNRFGKEFWQAAKIVAQHSKAAVWVGYDAKNSCSNKWTVTLETINKILDKL